MVTSSYPKFPGDVTAPFIESIARGVAQLGHEVDVVLPFHPQLRRGDDEPVRFFAYHYAPRRDWNLWGYAQSLRADVSVRGAALLVAPLAAMALRQLVSERLRGYRYDALHAHWVIPNAALVADLARAYAVPLTVSLHGSDIFLPERIAALRPLTRHTFAVAGAVTACSADLRARALSLGAPPSGTRTVPYGVDLELFTPRPAARDEWRTRLRAGPDELLVLAVGRLVEKKGFRYLIEACSGLGGIRVAIAGAGDLKSVLDEQARSGPVTLVGALERDELARALSAADVVAVPSVRDAAGNVDGLPNALLEGLASGRAVVASRVAGIPDVIEDGANGLLVPPGDAEALAGALTRLAGNAALRERLGRAARQTAEQRLNWRIAALAFEECYAQAAALDAR
jgi:glycosyltransferase involved in cell wall biosynthesis